MTRVFTSWEKKRLLVGRLKRFTRWGYWPASVVYFPIVVFNCFYLAIKYRGLMVFTAANPAIEDGGVINESKKDILKHLALSGDEAIPNFLELLFEESLEVRKVKVEKALSEGYINFPCVFKPNAGQRGTGVVVVHDQDELDFHLESMKEDHLLQAFCHGREVSVFYYRYPTEKTGRVFSVTLKQLPEVIGDGQSTLLELILKHDKHVCMAQYLVSILKDRLDEVPKNKEVVILNEIGAHCKGTIFSDGQAHITTDLVTKINSIMCRDQGLCFGRFDIMVPDLESLEKGVNLKIIELNGVTSESTNIYDEKFSIFGAWKVLLKQWSIAYRIGHEQRALGNKPSSLIKIIQQILTYRKKVITYSGVGESQA